MLLEVSSRYVLVEHYVRTDDDGWLLRAYGPSDVVRVQGPDASLAVDELYRMAFDADAG